LGKGMELRRTERIYLDESRDGGCHALPAGLPQLQPSFTLEFRGGVALPRPWL
jgi:hypothetical protein